MARCDSRLARHRDERPVRERDPDHPHRAAAGSGDPSVTMGGRAAAGSAGHSPTGEPTAADEEHPGEPGLAPLGAVHRWVPLAERRDDEAARPGLRPPAASVAGARLLDSRSPDRTSGAQRPAGAQVRRVSSTPPASSLRVHPARPRWPQRASRQQESPRRWVPSASPSPPASSRPHRPRWARVSPSWLPPSSPRPSSLPSAAPPAAGRGSAPRARPCDGRGRPEHR